MTASPGGSRRTDTADVGAVRAEGTEDVGVQSHARPERFETMYIFECSLVNINGNTWK